MKHSNYLGSTNSDKMATTTNGTVILPSDFVSTLFASVNSTTTTTADYPSTTTTEYVLETTTWEHTSPNNLTKPDHLKENIDGFFLLANGMIVLLMQAGFACLEAGAVRSKNVTNIIMKNLMDVFMSCLGYWIIGYALAYSSGNCFMGLNLWASVGLTADRLPHWFFQFVFAATAATIVSGAVAERCQYNAYLVYSFVISGFMYPIVSHWVWADEGWLNKLGYRDFAGSGAVHLLAGICSLVGAIIIGPRIGRFPDKASRWTVSSSAPPPPAGHSVPITGLGGLLLIVGFLAFNGGSLGHMTQDGDIGIISRVMINTVVGGTGGSVITLVAGRLGLAGAPAAWGFANTLNGAFAGMVCVCAAADQMVFWSSFVSGLIAGVLYLAIHLFIIWCKVDDPLDTVAVHFGGGFWGLLAGSIFTQNGLVYGSSEEAIQGLLYHLAGAVAIAAWAAAVSIIMFGGLRVMGLLRVTTEQELQGLDIALHAEPGYPPSAWSSEPAVSVLPLGFDKIANHKSNKKTPKYRPTNEFNNMAFEETERSSS